MRDLSQTINDELPDRLTLGENCGTLHRRGHQHQSVSRSIQSRRFSYAHVSTQRDFHVRQATLRMSLTERAHAVYDEGVDLDRGLEPLQTVPYPRARPSQLVPEATECREATHMSCSAARSARPRR